jgi:hypothetical protein
MPRLASIWLHSAGGDGYNDLTPLSAIRRGPGAMTGENSAEARLREKLRKIEALFAGAGTAGEKAAAGAAADRIRALLGNAAGSEALEEIRFSVPDIWSRKLFIALCRRYGIRPFRYHRMHMQTVIVKAPRSFVDGVLWPEFQELSSALTTYLAEITEKLIREEVHGEMREAEEIDEPRRLGR